MFGWKRYTYNIMPDADVKFYLTASIKIRASRRTKELKKVILMSHIIMFTSLY